MTDIIWPQKLKHTLSGHLQKKFIDPCCWQRLDPPRIGYLLLHASMTPSTYSIVFGIIFIKVQAGSYLQKFLLIFFFWWKCFLIALLTHGFSSGWGLRSYITSSGRPSLFTQSKVLPTLIPSSSNVVSFLCYTQHYWKSSTTPILTGVRVLSW